VLKRQKSTKTKRTKKQAGEWVEEQLEEENQVGTTDELANGIKRLCHTSPYRVIMTLTQGV